MTSLGVPRLVVSKILNYVESGVTAVYDRHSYDGEKREALDVWARELMAILKNDPTDTVMFSRATPRVTHDERPSDSAPHRNYERPGLYEKERGDSRSGLGAQSRSRSHLRNEAHANHTGPAGRHRGPSRRER
jgi:hypothetical protein